MAEAKLSEQVTGQAAPEVVIEKKAARRIEDSLAKIGGFKTIKGFLPDAENMDLKNRAQRSIFLNENRFGEKRKKLASDLKKWLDLLAEDKKTPMEYAESCSQKEKKYKELFMDNLSIATDTIKKLETEYRTMDMFFKNTGSDKIRNLRLINVDKNELQDSNSDFIKEINELLKNSYDRLSLKDNYSLMVMPGYVFEDNTVLRLWAQMAHKYKVMLITDHADEANYNDMVDNTERYRDSDVFLQNIILTSNWLLGRKKEDMAREEDNFYVPPSGALAGKMYDDTRNIADPSAGKKHGTLNEVKGVRLDLLKSEIAGLMDKQVIPMVFSEGRVMAFNDTTLFNGDNKAMTSYTIVRVFDWIKKVLMNFLNDEALQNWDTVKSPKILKEKIQDFLNQHKGYGKLFQDYTLGNPSQDPLTKNITVDMQITPYFSAKNFVVKLSATKNKGPGFEKECDVS
jgi:hypothetical protein